MTEPWDCIRLRKSPTQCLRPKHCTVQVLEGTAFNVAINNWMKNFNIPKPKQHPRILTFEIGIQGPKPWAKDGVQRPCAGIIPFFAPFIVKQHDCNLWTWGKCRKHSPVAHAFDISLVFSNARCVLSQCNTQLRLLYLLNIIKMKMIYLEAPLFKLPHFRYSSMTPWF